LKKILFLFKLFVCSYQFAFSQSSFGIGIGVGHQFGLPGLRANYNWKRFDASLNFGLFGKARDTPGWINVSQFEKFNYCFGSGISYRLNKKQIPYPVTLPNLNDMIFNYFITYNYGYVLSHSYTGYFSGVNLVYFPSQLHTLSSSAEFCLMNNVKFRIGFGYTLRLQNKEYDYFPTGSLGIIYSIM
jgi:hypothetical protein